MEHVLEILWRQVAEPVLNEIMSNIPDDKGKRKEYEKSVSQDMVCYTVDKTDK